MRHRIYFQENEPVEVTCYRLEVQPGAMRVRTWPEEKKTSSVDVGFTEPIHSICDNHGRLVWPTAEAVIGKAKEARHATR